MEKMLFRLVNLIRRLRGFYQFNSIEEIERVLAGGETDAQIAEVAALTAQAEALKSLVALTMEMLAAIEPAFAAPAFQNRNLDPAGYVWPSTYAMASPAILPEPVLGRIGAVTREWARAELIFDASIRNMAIFPAVAQTELAQNLNMYSFKAKATTWKRIQDLSFLTNPEGLSFSKHILSQAKTLSSIRNELTHWNHAPHKDMPSAAIFMTGKVGEPRTAWYSVWTPDDIEAVIVRICHLQTALMAFGQYCLSIWLPSLPDKPAWLTSDTGLLTLRSYLAQPPIRRPPRKRGYPLQLEPSPD